MSEVVGDGLRLAEGSVATTTTWALVMVRQGLAARSKVLGEVEGLNGAEHLRLGPPDGTAALGDGAVDRRARRRILRLLSGYRTG
jgi:hypothetical protein